MTNVSLNRQTRACVPDNLFLGYEGENEVNKLVFKFEDEFFDGSGLLNVQRGEQKGYVALNKVGETYELPVKNSLLSQKGDVIFQLSITSIAGAVIKFNPFAMTVKDSIDTDAELPEEYPSWIDEANAKLAEIDKAIEDAEKLSAKVEQTEKGALITITDKEGTTTAEVFHGTGGGGGGGTVSETDPVYSKDKPNIALKSEIPTNLSQLNNDINFATETYVDEEIAKFDFIKVVDALPETGLPNRIYFVPKTDTDTRDLFDEYAWINDAWEYITTKQIEVDLTTKQDTLVSGTNIKTINGESILGEGDITIEGGSSSAKVTLWTGKLNAVNQTATLSESLENFDYILIKSNITNANDVRRYMPVSCIDTNDIKEIYGTDEKIITDNFYDASASSSLLIYVGFNNSTTMILHAINKKGTINSYQITEIVGVKI